MRLTTTPIGAGSLQKLASRRQASGRRRCQGIAKVVVVVGKDRDVVGPVQGRGGRAEVTGVRSTAASGLRFFGLGPFLVLIVRLSARSLLVVGEHRSAIAVGHLSDFDDLCGVGLPLFGREEVKVTSLEAVTFGFIGRLDRHIEEPRELFHRCGPSAFRNCVADAVGGAGELGAEARETQS